MPCTRDEKTGRKNWSGDDDEVAYGFKSSATFRLESDNRRFLRNGDHDGDNKRPHAQ